MSGVHAIPTHLNSTTTVSKVFASQEDATDWINVPIKGAEAKVWDFGTGTVLLEHRDLDTLEVSTVWTFSDTNDAKDNVRVIKPIVGDAEYRLRASTAPSGSPQGRIRF